MKNATQKTKHENRIGSKNFWSSSSERMQPLFRSSFALLTLIPRALVCIMILKGLIVHSLVIADDEVHTINVLTL